MAHHNFVSKWNERDLPDSEGQYWRDALQESIDAVRDDLRALTETFGEKEDAWTKEQKQAAQAVRDNIQRLEADLVPVPKAMACDEHEVVEVSIHLRGNHLQLIGSPLRRAFPKIFESVVEPVPFPPAQSGRLELAKWLTHPDHPLTARVMANRIWQGHFGEGLVRTSSNFGTKGEPASHPELLDFLADELIRSGWSLKHLHRLIMASATYQQSWRFDATAANVDPDNRLWWRQNRRRLELEPMRDAIIAVAGCLDRSLDGDAEKAELSSYRRTKISPTVHDTLRRTIYLPINRAAIHELFSTFDYVDSSVSIGKRSSTTVPHQALFFMNHPLVMEMSMELADRLKEVSSDASVRVNFLFQTIFNRPVRSDELGTVLRHSQEMMQQIGDIPEAEREQAVWSEIARAMLSANEFIHVE
jgi:hypothetical protein